MGHACTSGYVSEHPLSCACTDGGLCHGCITHDEVIVGTDDPMRGVLRFRASGSHALPEEFRTRMDRRSHLGICSLGSVVESVHVPSDSVCALKRISKKLLSSSAWRADVERLRELDHPHICKTLDAFEDSTSVYLVMEMCRGGNLNTLARMGSRIFTEAHVAVLVYQMVQAVAYLHNLGFVHCDICPENWLFEKDLNEATLPNDVRLKMIDFGLAQKYAREPPRKPTRYSYPNAPGLTVTERRTSRISNTSSTQTSRSGRSRKSSKDDLKKRPLTSSKLFCQAPEQLEPVSVSSAAADVWAIGILSYFLLLGNSPFEPSKGVTNPSNNLAFKNARYVFMPTEVWRHISTEAKSFIALCLEKEPEKRPDAKTLLEMPWMRMAKSLAEGASLPMVLPEKQPQEPEPIPAMSSTIDTASASTPRSRLSFTDGSPPGAQMAQGNLQRFNEYQCLEQQIISTVAHEVHRQNLAQLRLSLEETDFERSGFVQWAVLMSCIRQCGGALADMDVDILPDVSGGLVNYNDFLTDVAMFQRNTQESALWYAFSAHDSGRGEADRRKLQRDFGDARSLMSKCITVNFPGVSHELIKQSLQEASSSRVKFEDLLNMLNSAPCEVSKEKQRFSRMF